MGLSQKASTQQKNFPKNEKATHGMGKNMCKS